MGWMVDVRPGVLWNRNLPASSGQSLSKRFHHDRRVHASCNIGIGLCPGLGIVQRVKFRDNQTPGEAGGTGVVAVNRGKRPRQQQSPLVLQRFEPIKVCRSRSLATLEAFFNVDSANGVPHQSCARFPEVSVAVDLSDMYRAM